MEHDKVCAFLHNTRNGMERDIRIIISFVTWGQFREVKI